MAAEEGETKGRTAESSAAPGAMAAKDAREEKQDHGKPERTHQELRRGGVAHESHEGENGAAQHGSDVAAL